MALYVGTSGWAYREWRPGFYPRGVPQSRWLEHYAHRLSACEINATFYQLQSGATFSRWASLVPASFRFAAKAHRRLTHSRQTMPDAAQRRFLEDFFRPLSTLGTRLGPVLFQFPARYRRDDESFVRLLEALPQGLLYALEFRNDSWNDASVAARAAAAGGTLCLSDSTGEPPEALPPGPIAYVRLRFDSYSDAACARWKHLLHREAESRDVYAFAKHEGVAAGDPHAGVGLAEWLASGG